MHIDEWIKDVKKKGGVDIDGYYGKQCVDLHNDYCTRVLGLTGKTGASYAKQLINNTYLLNHCKKIKNTLLTIPQKGDIAVWTGGQYGHVAIVLAKGNLNSFKSLDQNWVAQKLTEEKHNYTYLAPLYFLRPLDQKNIVTKKTKYAKGDYKTLEIMNIRTGAGTSFSQKKVKNLTADGKKNATSKDMEAYACYKKGTIFTAQKITENKDGSYWAKTPSGYICIEDSKNKYCTKI